MELKVPGVSDRDAVKILSSKIAFIEEDTIRVINKFNLDCILKIVDDDNNFTESGRKMKKVVLHSAVKLDNLFTNQTELNNRH